MLQNPLLVLVAPHFWDRKKKCQKKNWMFVWRIFTRLRGIKMAHITQVHSWSSPKSPHWSFPSLAGTEFLKFSKTKGWEFTKTIIPFALVGNEIVNSQLVVHTTKQQLFSRYGKNENCCERHKNGNARALRAKVLFFIVEYAHFVTFFVTVAIVVGNCDKLSTCLHEFVLSLIKSVLTLKLNCDGTLSLSRCAWLKFDCLNWHDMLWYKYLLIKVD